jgi:hypothetical protein
MNRHQVEGRADEATDRFAAVAAKVAGTKRPAHKGMAENRREGTEAAFGNFGRDVKRSTK